MQLVANAQCYRKVACDNARAVVGYTEGGDLNLLFRQNALYHRIVYAATDKLIQDILRLPVLSSYSKAVG